MYRFAVQALNTDNVTKVAEVTIRAAKQLGLNFKHLGVVDWMTLGTSKFLILQANLPFSKPLLDLLFESGRGVIGITPLGFEVRLGTKTAKVASTQLQGPAKNPLSYLGPGDPLWERQFTKPN